MIKKFIVCIKNLFKKLAEEIEHRIPGYLVHCEDCGHIKRVTFLKGAQRFLCGDCIDRYVKLYIKTDNIENENGQVV